MPGPPLADAPGSLADAVAALGPHPSTDAALDAFSAWCRATTFAGARRDHAWIAAEHPYAEGEPSVPGARSCALRLARELAPAGAGPEVTAEVVLWFPLPDALRRRLDAPLAETAWSDAPARADRLVARFRAALGPLFAPYSPRLSPDGG